MDDPGSEPIGKREPEIAAADWLLQDEPARNTNAPQGNLITPTSTDGFALADTPATEAFPTASASDAPIVPEAGMVPPNREHGRTRSQFVLESASPVEQVWSRTGEWGTTLVFLSVWGLVVALLLYISVGAEWYEAAAVIFGLGGLGFVVLSYPILITLERPVRVTPEQAARDYFNSLSHHLPHHRRMWLLLSSPGRVSRYFASYEGFKTYWVQKLRDLRKGHAGSLSPLVFVVEDFRAEKSVGKTRIDGQFKLRVLVRGRRNEGPIWSFPMKASFSRGPDGMWYLDDGVLPEPSKPVAPRLS